MIPASPEWHVIKNEPLLSSRQFMKYFDAEWDLFKLNLKGQLFPLLEQIKGNPFKILIHYADTLANISKYYAIITQFVNN